MNKLFKKDYIYRLISGMVLAAFTLNTVTPPAWAQSVQSLAVKPPVLATSAFNPVMLKGLKIYADNPLKFDFIIDTGDESFSDDALKSESDRLIKYFLASLTVPEQDLWVNLSPKEKDRIIPDAFSQTDMGRDMLAQDFILKQISSALTDPRSEVGKKYWNELNRRGASPWASENGQTQGSVPTEILSKIWIVPEKAVVYENDDTAFVVESHLKVMMKGDDLSMTNTRRGASQWAPANNNGPAQGPAPTDIMKQTILPAIEREVNEGANFAKLRQIYNALILATWFKRNLKESILGQVYVGKNKIDGVDIADKDAKEKIYQQYLKAFSDGAYKYVQEQYNPTTQEVEMKQYFSGGEDFTQFGQTTNRALSIEKIGGDTNRWSEIMKGVVGAAIITTVLLASASTSNAQDTRKTPIESQPVTSDSKPADQERKVQSKLFYPDGKQMLGVEEPGIAYYPYESGQFKELLDVKDGGKGDAAQMALAGFKVIKVYLGSVDEIKNFTPIAKKIYEVYGLKTVTIFSPYYLKIVDPKKTEAIKKTVEIFVEQLAKHPWIIVQLGNEENYWLRNARFTRNGGGIALTKKEYFKFYDDVAGMLQDEILRQTKTKKVITLGVGVNIDEADWESDLEKNLVLIKNMKNVSGLMINAYFPAADIYPLVLRYINERTNLPVVLGEYGQSQYQSTPERQGDFNLSIRRSLVSDSNSAGTILFAYKHKKPGTEELGYRADREFGIQNTLTSGEDYYRFKSAQEISREKYALTDGMFWDAFGKKDQAFLQWFADGLIDSARRQQATKTELKGKAKEEGRKLSDDEINGFRDLNLVAAAYLSSGKDSLYKGDFEKLRSAVETLQGLTEGEIFNGPGLFWNPASVLKKEIKLAVKFSADPKKRDKLVEFTKSLDNGSSDRSIGLSHVARIAEEVGSQYAKLFDKYGRYWKSHIDNSRKAILEGAALTNKKTATIIGASEAREIPLRELLQMFDEVKLVDIDYKSLQRAYDSIDPEEYDNQRRLLQDKITLIQADITGGAINDLAKKGLQLIEESVAPAELGEKLKVLLRDFDLVRAIDKKRLGGDFVVSSVIATQIIVSAEELWVDAINRKFEYTEELVRLFENEYQQLNIQIIKRHTRILSQLVNKNGVVYFATDVNGQPYFQKLSLNDTSRLYEQFVVLLRSKPWIKEFDVNWIGSQQEKLVHLLNGRVVTTDDKGLVQEIIGMIGTKKIPREIEEKLIDAFIEVTKSFDISTNREVIPGKDIGEVLFAGLQIVGEKKSWRWFNNPQVVYGSGGIFDVQAVLLKPVSQFTRYELPGGATMFSPLVNPAEVGALDPTKSYFLSYKDGIAQIRETKKAWGFTDTSLIYIEKMFGVDLAEHIEALDADRRVSDDPNRPVTILDWGMGKGVVLADLVRKLKERGKVDLSKIRFYGLSVDFYTEYKNLPPEIVVIFESGKNINRYFEAGEIDFVFSNLGLHYYSKSNEDRKRYFRLLSGLMSDGAEIIMDNDSTRASLTEPLSDEELDFANLMNVSQTKGCFIYQRRSDGDRSLAAGNDGSGNGAMKPIGLSWETVGELSWKNLHEEFSRLGRTVEVTNLNDATKAKIITYDLGVWGSYYFKETSGGWIIVLNSNHSKEIQDEALFHESTEIDLQTRFPDLMPKDVHIVSSAVQRQYFAGNKPGKLTPFDELQLNGMTTLKLFMLKEEFERKDKLGRSKQQNILNFVKDSLGVEVDIEFIVKYEDVFYQRVKQLFELRKPWNKFSRSNAETALAAEFVSRLLNADERDLLVMLDGFSTFSEKIQNKIIGNLQKERVTEEMIAGKFLTVLTSEYIRIDFIEQNASYTNDDVSEKIVLDFELLLDARLKKTTLESLVELYQNLHSIHQANILNKLKKDRDANVKVDAFLVLIGEKKNSGEDVQKRELLRVSIFDLATLDAVINYVRNLVKKGNDVAAEETLTELFKDLNRVNNQEDANKLADHWQRVFLASSPKFDFKDKKKYIEQVLQILRVLPDRPLNDGDRSVVSSQSDDVGGIAFDGVNELLKVNKGSQSETLGKSSLRFSTFTGFEPIIVDMHYVNWGKIIATPQGLVNTAVIHP